MQQRVQTFCETYTLYEDDAIQQTQLRHRFALVEAFGLEQGMRVLEIGCGQGDTTVVLADIVGETGHVIALDVAHGDYGAPFTLSQAHDRIAASPLGPRISFHLQTDFLTFPVEDVDVIVLSHSSWYFKSEEQLRQYFEKAKTLGVKLCVADWDMAYTSLAQRCHFCAASILALYSTFIENDGNIQNVWSKKHIENIAQAAHFQLVRRETVDASYLQDGRWERDYANAIIPEFATAPPSIQTLVQCYRDVMNETEDADSLHSFVYAFE